MKKKLPIFLALCVACFFLYYPVEQWWLQHKPLHPGLNRIEDMLYARDDSVSLSLQSSGKLLIIGGGDKNFEEFDYKTRKFQTVEQKTIFDQSLAGHFELKNGKVLISGSRGDELFDPKTGKSEMIAKDTNYPSTINGFSNALPLNNGSVLRILSKTDYERATQKAWSEQFAEIYEPNRNSFFPLGELPFEKNVWLLLELPNEEVLVFGDNKLGVYNLQQKKVKFVGNIGAKQTWWSGSTYIWGASFIDKDKVLLVARYKSSERTQRFDIRLSGFLFDIKTKQLSKPFPISIPALSNAQVREPDIRILSGGKNQILVLIRLHDYTPGDRHSCLVYSYSFKNSRVQILGEIPNVSFIPHIVKLPDGNFFITGGKEHSYDDYMVSDKKVYLLKIKD